jgi:hypothetical protein
MNKETNTYIAKLQECNKLVESIKAKTAFISGNKVSDCEEVAVPSMSELDREIGYVLHNLIELNSSIIV